MGPKVAEIKKSVTDKSVAKPIKTVEAAQYKKFIERGRV